MTSAARWGKRADMLVHEDEPFNAEPAPTSLAGRELTPIEAFYTRNHGPIPEIDPTAWRLTVDGRVVTPLTLALAELTDRFEQVTVTATLQCAGDSGASQPAEPAELWNPKGYLNNSWPRNPVRAV